MYMIHDVHDHMNLPQTVKPNGLISCLDSTSSFPILTDAPRAVNEKMQLLD